MPPVAVTSFSSSGNSTGGNSTAFDASQFGPDCPSNHNAGPNRRGVHWRASNPRQAILTAEAQTGRPLSEDCLSLSVWTKPQSGTGAPKAVLFWIFGGARAARPDRKPGSSIGNKACEFYDGSVLTDENDVVVVSSDYRVKIFGFPGAPGLQQQNVGLLDQRMALEGARDNVAAFGGDPSRITVSGQSAGGASTDHLSIMYPDDPIANGFIPQSGVASGGGVTAYRYRFYGGNYTNLYINYVGAAYHTAELPVVVGTASWLTKIQDTPAQASMGAWMRSAWAEFARGSRGRSGELGLAEVWSRR
ncbi:hypothetical protein diail_3435 [Diaporthe ilicicola]|nr:hypothetical protein diail_3435 [Diaporthe ilicicola]